MELSESKQIFIDQLCADFGPARADLSSDIVVAEAVGYGEHARKYLSGTPFLHIVYMDGRLIVVVDRSIAAFARAYASALAEPFRAFDAPYVFMLEEQLRKAGHTVGTMTQGFLLSDDAPRTSAEKGVRIFRGSEIEQLYCDKTLKNAFCYSTTDRRRDVLAAAIFDGDKLAAVAACSNDGERMWQIGVDVLPEYRRRGYGAMVVRAIAAEAEREGACPYYCCAWSNVASMRTARAAGFVPCWAELSAVSVDDGFAQSFRDKVFGKLSSS